MRKCKIQGLGLSDGDMGKWRNDIFGKLIIFIFIHFNQKTFFGDGFVKSIVQI